MPMIAEQRVYIYTIPKSGTYLMSGFLRELGLRSSGMHIALNHTLETHAVDSATNLRSPSKAMVQKLYIDAFRSVPPRQHAFGHLSPLYLPAGIINRRGYQFIAVKRHPREVLESEFVDFRHRRLDVDWVSESSIPDPQQAFETYLSRHGAVIRDICIEFMLLEQIAHSPMYQHLMGGRNRHLFVDFSRFIDRGAGPRVAAGIATFLLDHTDTVDVRLAWQKALEADNKTKATMMKLPYERASLWTTAAEAHYRQLGLHQIADQLGCVG
jgi:hypothetical protein